jgi:hypothetical protein
MRHSEVPSPIAEENVVAQSPPAQITLSKIAHAGHDLAPSGVAEGFIGRILMREAHGGFFGGR